jgi:acyl-coenzyme A thioesterase PaaI-like protein
MRGYCAVTTLTTLLGAMTARPAMSAHELQDFLRDAFPGTPIPYVVEAITADTVTVRLPINMAASRPGGTVSGPSLMALADAAAWLVIVGPTVNDWGWPTWPCTRSALSPWWPRPR